MKSKTARGFTLIEVLVAMAVLVLISAGLLVTTWRLVGLAQDQVDSMVANSYCHDMILAVVGQKYDDIKPIDSFRLDPRKDLPRIETTDIFGEKSVVVPMLRRYRAKTADDVYKSIPADKVPTCRVAVDESPSNKTIVVTVAWGQTTGDPPFSHSLRFVRGK